MNNSSLICVTCSTVIKDCLHATFIKSNLTLIIKLFLCFPDLDLLVQEKLVLCKKCVDDVNTLYTFKNQYLEKENQINKNMKIVNITLEYHYPFNILYSYLKFSNVTTPTLDSTDCTNNSTYFPEICRICLFNIRKNSYRVYLDFVQLDIEQMLTRKNLYWCCPELDLRIHSSMAICTNCFNVISKVNKFKPEYKDSARPFFLGFSNVPSLQISKIEDSLKQEISWCTIDNNWYKQVKDILHSQEKSLEYKTNATQEAYLINNINKDLYLCLKCDYATRQKDSFVNHEQIHTGEKLFKCTICHYRSSQKSNLKQHIVFHTGEKSIKCAICGFCANEKSSLKQHLLCHIEKTI